MSKFTFQITAEAVDYIRKYLLQTSAGDQIVLVIAPVSHGGVLNIDPNDLNFSKRELIAMATEFAKSLPLPIEFRWVVSGMHKNRLPDGDFRVVDGIECFLPEEVRSVVNGRVLRLESGELRFDPQLEPPNVEIETLRFLEKLRQSNSKE
jgi:hypothetical protein